MSTQDNDNLPVQDELAALKARAEQLGVKYHPSISLDKLREKVNAAIEGNTLPKPPADPQPGDFTPGTEPAPETPGQKRARLKKEALKLVRIRVSCMNPAKKEWEGEIFTVGNSAIGSIKKYVPFNVEDGWHVPHIIYQQIKDRQCQIFVAGKAKNGVTIRQAKLIKEFSVEVLPPLTEAELHDLAQRQAMSGAVTQ